jgi:tetratricopeptide (TPR) repeat protein
MIAAALFAALAAGAWSEDAAVPSTPAPPKGLEPIFPAENPNLIFIEAEDAVSTNFAREPTLNFGVSGFRALQLNRSTGLEGVGSFYADYVFTLPSSGTWELWYGGTPPGPKDELYPSYTSPFSLTADAQKPQAVTRESVAVVENYSPSFYWNRVGDLSLDAGRHQFRFEVTEKRRIDGRYLFYLDCFFLVKKEGGERLLAEPLPSVFPKNMDDRKIDVPFPSIDDSLIKIRDNPGATGPLVDIARLYALLGDYLNALKYLNRAAALQPKDPDIALLIAKNRIWKGDIADGLKKFREVLGMDPKQRELWLEAGKVAAWNGNYDESIGFFRDALSAFPDDMDLTINLGLAYLWAGKGSDAEGEFHSAQALAGSDAGRLKDLGRVYRVNGYPDRAVQAYTAAANAAPQDLESYLLLIDTLLSMGKKGDAEAAKKRITDTFVTSPRLTAFLAAFQEKEGLKDQVLEEYNVKLQQNPNNLVLRQVLAESYFWTGLKDKAVGEYRHILANYAYLALSDSETRSALLPQVIDRGYVLEDYLSRFPGMARQSQDALAVEMTKLAQAGAASDAAQKTLDSARQAQAKAKEGAEADAAQIAVNNAEDKLLAAEQSFQAEGRALAALVNQAAALAAQFGQVKVSLSADTESSGQLAAQDTEAEATFAQSTKTNKWRFDRSGMLAELAQDTADNDLARIVAAKIYMADHLPSQVQALLRPDAASSAATSAVYTLAQSYLWAGNVKDASPLVTRLTDAPGSAQIPAYFKDLSALMQSLANALPSSPQSAASLDPEADAKAVSAQLAGLEKEATVQQAQLQKNLIVLHALYRRVVIRTFYAFEQQVSSIRNELGDYYLAADPPALDPAITQFKRVLAVDPGDLDATFRLGKVYEWKRDWQSALDSYQIVYKADPYFENVAALYNHLAREHAETLSSLASAFADTQNVKWHAEATWTRWFDTTFGLAASYQTDDISIERANISAGMDHSSYQVQDVSLGLPIDLYLLNVKLTPWIGGLLEVDGLFQRTDLSDAAVTSSGDLFQTIYAAEPYVKLDASAGAWNALYMYGTMRWGRLPESLDPVRDVALYDASGEASLITLFSFIDAWPLHDTTLRTYGRVDYIQTSALAYKNALYTALQEITINVLKGGSPYGVLALTGNVTLQHSDYIEPYLYYAPPDLLMAGGSLTGSLSIGMSNGDIVSISLRGYGGSYQEYIFDAVHTNMNWIKAEGEADVTLTHGDAIWSLTALGNATYNLGTTLWDYWSLYLKLGYTIKLPRLLAP